MLELSYITQDSMPQRIKTKSSQKLGWDEKQGEENKSSPLRQKNILMKLISRAFLKTWRVLTLEPDKREKSEADLWECEHPRKKFFNFFN